MSTIATHPALAFQPPTLLLERICETHGVSRNEAQESFDETKKFLLFCRLNPDTRHSPSKQIDEVWHKFMLFSRSYAAFCDQIGGFIHHEPSATPEVDVFNLTIHEMTSVYGTLNPKYWSSNAVAGNCCSSCSSCGSSAH